MLWALGIVLGAVVFGAFTGYKTHQSWQTRRSIANASATTAGQVSPGQGPVELNGTAQAAEHSFQSPLTEQECVAYRFLKEEKQKKRVKDHTSDNNNYKTKYEWVTIHDEEAGAPFYLNDGVGRALVDGSTADLDMERSYEISTDDVEQGIGEKVVASVKGLAGRETTAEEPEIPEKYVEELKSTSYGRRYKEWVIHEGEQVYVYGEPVEPNQTPLGNGLESEMSAASDAMGGGIFSMLKGMVGFGTDAVRNPQTRYKPRAIKRLSDTMSAQDSSSAREQDQLTEIQSKAESLAEQAQQKEGQAAGKDMMEQANEMFDQTEAVVEESLPNTPAMDAERVVISWGQQVPSFVISDQGKGSILRDYSTGVVKYALVTILALAVAVGALAFAVGILSPTV